MRPESPKDHAMAAGQQASLEASFLLQYDLAKALLIVQPGGQQHIAQDVQQGLALVQCGFTAQKEPGGRLAAPRGSRMGCLLYTSVIIRVVNNFYSTPGTYYHRWLTSLLRSASDEPVSYTHLDVYKRQMAEHSAVNRRVVGSSPT